MERTRIDLAGSGSRGSERAGSSKASARTATNAEKRKNLILLAVATVILLISAYFIYANYFATTAPATSAEPAVDATFQDATSTPPPPADSQPLPEPGIGKRPAGG